MFGRGYEQLIAALERLRGTSIKTNIKTGGVENTSGFGLIDSWNVMRHTESGRMSEMRVNLSDWVFNAVAKHEVLTLHRDYFRLRKPLERRMYELARKHCGQQDEWAISLDLLRKKTGSASSDKEFHRLVGEICDENAAHDHIPDYSVRLDGNNVRFTNRKTMKALPSPETTLFPKLDLETYNDARIVAPGYDVYYLEQEWRNFWVESGTCRLRQAPTLRRKPQSFQEPSWQGSILAREYEDIIVQATNGAVQSRLADATAKGDTKKTVSMQRFLGIDHAGEAQQEPKLC